jgi:hypothetical protein
MMQEIIVDDNGDFEIEKTIYGYDYDDNGIKISIDFTFEQIEEAYLLAKSKKYPDRVKYGCHVEDEILDDCVFDGGYSISDCKHAEMLDMIEKCKTDCQYWRPIEVKK